MDVVWSKHQNGPNIRYIRGAIDAVNPEVIVWIDSRDKMINPQKKKVEAFTGLYYGTERESILFKQFYC